MERAVNNQLSIRGVSRTFTSAHGKKTQALLPVDFEVRENDFVTILGPSGCGK
ncbi:MAG TPA: ABC transporter ATP-binding protein, partial [Variovorax sp.]|nr:ABC transporter ATP-binding protein [Variovorax sp.]